MIAQQNGTVTAVANTAGGTQPDWQAVAPPSPPPGNFTGPPSNVSYPTIKSRLNRIASALQFVETNPRPSQGEILERLKRGEITAEQAVRELENL